MAWLKRPRDTGDIDITSTLSGIASGSVYLTRIGSQVWLDFQDVVAARVPANVMDDGSYFRSWNGAIPSGYRPFRMIDLALGGRPPTPSEAPAPPSSGPVRISPTGQIVVYRHSGPIRGLVTWYTRDPMPTRGA